MRAGAQPRTWPALPLLAGAYASGAAAAAAAGGLEGWAAPSLVGVILAAALVTRGVATLLVAAAAFALAGTAFVRHETALAAPVTPLATMSGIHTIVGVVRADPVARGRFGHIDVSVHTIDGQPATGGIRVTFPLLEGPPREGDRVALRGEIGRPGDIEAFDYAAYLRSRGVDAVAGFPDELRVLARDTGNPLARALRSARRTAIENVERSLPEPESSLAVGMLLGRQGTLPPELAANLRATGTTHLVVVSGQNVALVLGALTSLLALALPRRTAALFALAALPAYVTLVGPEPPVVRAALMAVGVTLGSVTGRRTPGWVYLLYAFAAMVAIDPALIVSISFQLSATATWGVIVLAPPLRDVVARGLRAGSSGVAFALVEVTATSTAALAAVLPVQAAVFGALPLAAIPANVVAAPLYASTLLIGALAAAFGSIDAVADALWTAGVAAPRLFVDMTALFSRGGAASLPASEPVLLAVAWYGCLGVLVWVLQLRPSEALEGRGAGRALAPVVLAVVTVGAWGVGSGPALPAAASVTILDVGQGLAVLVRDGSSSVLIDAGPPDGAVLRALPRGVSRTLEALVVTHADIDHAGGIADVRRRMRVERVFEGRPREGAARLALGERIQVGRDSWIEVLSPPDGPLGARESENDRSLVLLVRVGERRVLVAADIEAIAERWLVATGRDLGANALVVPHHGSRSSSTAAFIEAVAPAVAVVSAGAKNQFGHPHPEVVRRYEAAGARVLSTADRGSVTLVARDGGLEVTTAR